MNTENFLCKPALQSKFRMRKGIVYIFLLSFMTGIVLLFWYNEYVYSLPTPVPKNYNAVLPGQLIDLSAILKSNNNKPVLLHFFNPDCPCSRFNMPYFRSLAKKYGQEVNFAIVIMSGKKISAKEIKDKFDLNMPVLSDTSIATLCGVYSTPQAVIIDSMKKLFYRGNYNKTRYCTDKKTNYAEIALNGLLGRNSNNEFSLLDLKIYGCELPDCTK